MCKTNAENAYYNKNEINQISILSAALFIGFMV